MIDSALPAVPEEGDGDGDARATVTVGMTVALAAIGMTFAALLLAYGIVRAQAAAWPPPGEIPLPALWGLRLASTAAALGGSWAMRAAARAVLPRTATAAATDAPPLRPTRALAGALAAGVAFLTLQLASLRALGSAGVHPSSGLAASVVYALTAFHGLHALTAVILSLVLFAGRGQPRPERVRAVASFWHLVTAVWLVVFVAVFVA